MKQEHIDTVLKIFMCVSGGIVITSIVVALVVLILFLVQE